jgi:hypothetical protein
MLDIYFAIDAYIIDFAIAGNMQRFYFNEEILFHVIRVL